MNVNEYDYIVVGAGFAGATIANNLANNNKKVLVIDKRDHVGGNCYDYLKDNILIHQYGPHIFHTSNKEVFDYLSQFTNWDKYHHTVKGHIDNKLVPIPFNLESIDLCFDKDKATKLKGILINEYKEDTKVPILKLLENKDKDIQELSNYIFDNVFKYYTMKQWGLKANEIDPEVTARVPVSVSYKDGYFNDTYQYMPQEGYTKIFNNMLEHKNITIKLNKDIKDIIELENGLFYTITNDIYKGKIIYTGQLDYLFDYKLGDLPYRSLEFIMEKHNGQYQQMATENYPGKEEDYPYTRITEYKLLMKEYPKDITYIHKEYPLEYNKNAKKGNIPYYPIFTKDNQDKYNAYVEISKEYKHLYLLGRLAEYKYYNMDAMILKALELSKELLGE